MKFNPSSREQRTLPVIVVLAAFIGWVYLFYVVMPLWKAVKKSKQEIQRQGTRQRELQIAAKNIPGVKTQQAERERAVKVLKGQLPPEADVAAFMAELTDLASQAQMKIENIFPAQATDDRKGTGKSQAGSGEYKSVIIQIEGSAGYHQLGTFLSLVEGIQNPMQLSSLQIQSNSKNPKRHHIKLLLRAYVASGEGQDKG